MKKVILSVFAVILICSCATIKKSDPSKLPELVKNYTPFVYEVVDFPIIRKGYFTFRRSLNYAKYGYLAVKDPTESASVPVVERFEVRPGDCAEIDCKTDRERSELREMGHPNKEGETWWYGWSIFVPPEYPNVYPTKVALGQFHQMDGKPAFMFQNYKGGLWLDNQLRNRYYNLISKEDLRGRWHKVEVNVKWSRSGKGFLKVWVNGEQRIEIKGKTMSRKKVYFKYGVYRSFLSRYPKKAVPGQVVYYANVRKHTTREGLLPADL